MSVMTICTGCHQRLQNLEARFCPHCGSATGLPGSIPPAVAAHTPPPTSPAAPNSGAAQMTADGAQALPATTHRWRPRVALAIATVCAVIMGALFSHLAPAPAEGNRRIVAQMPIGPEGGTVSFGDGGKVEIPAGALSETKEIVIYETIVEEEVVLTPPNATAPMVFPAGTLRVYYFGPFNVSFLLPVTIAIPVPAGLVGQVFVSVNGAFQFISGQMAGNTVVVQVRGFGNGFLIVQ